MSQRIEDYAMIGDCETAALVGRDGSIDWLCLPRFDSDACFAALVGTEENGRWLIAPRNARRKVTRRYRDDTLVLETCFETDEGQVAVVDFMPVRLERPLAVRIVEGRRGTVPMHMQFILRFGYGKDVPWVRRAPQGIQAICGPDAIWLQSDVAMRGEGLTTVADFAVAQGESVAFSLSWYPSHKDAPSTPGARQALEETERWWRDWSGRSTYQGPWPEAVKRSLITLKGLTHAPTGGIVAAVTSSLPERLGGVRNWDYRYCWLRDATFTLFALLAAGYVDEAAAWREWLLRAVAGSPSGLQIVYGVRGERRLPELTLDWLGGYENSRPVRIGNAASEQFQLDVYGELLDAMYQCRCHGLDPSEAAWDLECALLGFVESAWSRPDEGIWEVRGDRRHFTHSKVMAWVALDRAVKSVERLGMPGRLDAWRALRHTIFEEVCRHGYSESRHAFVQYYGGEELDAALLMIPLVGFLPIDDPRVQGTLAAVERHLMVDGLVRRYAEWNDADGLPPGEGMFLACSFWLVDNYALAGRQDDARRVFERLLQLRNDVGLLSEQYEPRAARLLGNFPQALSHIGLINSALNLAHERGTLGRRSDH